MDNAEDIKTKLMFLVFINTGMRVSELTNMLITWINYDAGEIRIRKNDKPTDFEPKYCSERSIPLDINILKDLKQFIGSRKGGYVFKSNSKKDFHRYKTRSIINKFNDLSKELLGETIGTHIFRRTFCSHLLSQEVLITTISTLMGHKDIATTWRYIQHIPNYAEYEKVRNLDFKKFKIRFKEGKK